MLIELYVGNYAMYDDFVNGIDDIFKISKTYYDKTIIWIMFKKNLIGTLTKEKYNHYYNNIESKWTPIKPIIKYIRIGKYQSFIIRRIQFPIQLAIVKIICCFQGYH